MQFNKINTTDEAYAVIDAALNSTAEDRTDYNIVAKAYNDLAISQGMSFEFPKAKYPSLKKQLEKRGLVVGVDMQIRHVVDGADEQGNGGTDTVIMRRLTEKAAQILVITVPNRKKKGASSVQAGAANATGQEPGGPPATDTANAASAEPVVETGEAAKPAPAGKANPPKAASKK